MDYSDEAGILVPTGSAVGVELSVSENVTVGAGVKVTDEVEVKVAIGLG